MRRLLIAACREVPEIPAPTDEEVAPAVNVRTGESNRERNEAIGRPGGELHGRQRHDHAGRADTTGRGPVDVGGDECDQKRVGIGIGVRGSLAGAGRAVAKTPAPIGQEAAPAVHIRATELNRQWHQAVGRGDVERDGRLVGDIFQRDRVRDHGAA